MMYLGLILFFVQECTLRPGCSLLWDCPLIFQVSICTILYLVTLLWLESPIDGCRQQSYWILLTFYFLSLFTTFSHRLWLFWEPMIAMLPSTFSLQSWHGQSLWLVMNYTEADCNPEQFMPSVFSYSEAVSHPLGVPQYIHDYYKSTDVHQLVSPILLVPKTC
jgi:hypothetical protein